MSEPRSYVIRRAFVVPLGLVLLLMAALLAVSIAHGQPPAKIAFLVFFALPVVVLFAESALRRLTIDAAGVTARRLFRSRRIDFSRVTALDTVRVRSRVFLTLAAGDDEFLIISNGYADFASLVGSLVAAPPRRHADVVMVWFMIAALVYVLVAQFRG